MAFYRIADIVIALNTFEKLITAQALKYKIDQADHVGMKITSLYNEKIEISGKVDHKTNTLIRTKDADSIHHYSLENDVIYMHRQVFSNGIDTILEFFHRPQKYINLNQDDWEYMRTGSAFASGLLEYDGFVFHASALCVNGEAILFSAASGTGKSTHTQLWKKYVKSKELVILNDDKPALRLMNGEWRVYGTPWSGKTDLNVNASATLKAIVFLNQASDNFIRPLSSREAIIPLFEQSMGPSSEEKMKMRLALLDDIIKHIPMYQLDCTISEDAVKVVYEEILKEAYAKRKDEEVL